jgi:hypothetical protein
MASPVEKSFCILCYHETKSSVHNFSIGLCERFRVCAPPPITLQKLRGRITQAIAQIDENTLEKVWHEFDYRIDVCRVTCGAHIEGL